MAVFASVVVVSSLRSGGTSDGMATLSVVRDDFGEEALEEEEDGVHGVLTWEIGEVGDAVGRAMAEMVEIGAGVAIAMAAGATVTAVV